MANGIPKPNWHKSANGIAYGLRTKIIRNENALKHHRANRLLVLTHYSQGRLEYACCGDNRYCFLSIDHIVAVNQQFKKRPNTGNFYRQLIKDRLPIGFQVLCMNCNFLKRNKSKCPCKELIFQGQVPPNQNF